MNGFDGTFVTPVVLVLSMASIYEGEVINLGHDRITVKLLPVSILVIFVNLLKC